MRRAIEEYFVGGIKTNLSLFRRIVEHPDFVAARIDTGFLDRLLASPAAAAKTPTALADIVAVSAALFAATAGSAAGNGRRRDDPQQATASAWKRAARIEGIERP
jgi:acetyl-CoA carboxylase biotin carboxylase subunit